MHIYSALFNDASHLDKFGKCETVYHPAQIESKDSILILHGGQDISPSIYNQKPSRRTDAYEELSTRDISEIILARRAIELGIPIFGICRGAQLSCALAGGSLIQHVTGHIGGQHEVTTIDGDHYNSTTCHHQMMFLEKTDHELIAWASQNLSDSYIIEEEKEVKVTVEPEVVFFPKIKALAIQGHPEWMPRSCDFVQYCLKLVEEKLL